MFYSVDGKIVQVGEAFTERRVNTLTFQVAGTQFPDPTLSNINDARGQFSFDSDGPNSVIVNWGDGVVETFVFGSSNRIGWTYNGLESDNPQNFLPNAILTGDSLAGRHIYQDDNSGLRTITFEFLDLSIINNCRFMHTRLFGVFPEEIGFAINLRTISLTNTQQIIGFPKSIANNTNLTTINFSNAFADKLLQIPDGIFNSSVSTLDVNGSFDLSDLTSSNLFKINQLSSTLTFLNLDNCDVTEIPDSIGDCINLTTLRLLNCNVTISIGISKLVNLTRLIISYDNSTTTWTVFDDLNLINNAFFSGDSLPLGNLAEDWKGLKSLKSFALFQLFITSNARFDDFIDGFYQLCITEGFLNPASTEAIDTGFPNQFRNVSWGDSSLTQTGEIKAPAVDGDPQNQGEKIHELIYKYGHNVTTSGNFN